MSKEDPEALGAQGVKYDSKRHLVLKSHPKNFKFCRICGFKARASIAVMQKHYDGKHQGQPAEFLSRGQYPTHCMYSNWDQWFREREPDLKIKQEFQDTMYGRPRIVKALKGAAIMEDDDEELECSSR